MKTLDELSLIHKTDKGSLKQHYCDIYEKYFYPIREKPITLLEIGVQFGLSLRMWGDYFPNAKIVGLDSINNHNVFDNPRILEIIGDQSSHSDIERVKAHGPFDIIIDDGSHYSHDINNSLALLFGSVKRGGVYCVEDLHATYLPQFNPVKCTNAMDGLFGRVHVLNDHGKSQSGKPDEFASISFINFTKSLCIIGKS